MFDTKATCPLRNFYSVLQSDGTSLQIRKQGNGHFAFYSTKDGIALMPAANGDMQYAEITSEGLRASGVVAHNVLLRTALEKKFLNKQTISTQQAYEWMEKIHSHPYKYSRDVVVEDGLLPLGTSASGVVSSIGTPLIPVIMVSFPDRDFLEQSTPAKLTRLLNEKGYSDENYCKGSVKDYFTAQSNGLFTPTFQVVAKVEVSKPYAYYGENYPNGSIDKHVKDLVQEALDLANQAGVDFGIFAGADHRIPLVSIYYAGPGEHSSFETGCEDYIWAHFSKRNFVVDGVGVNSYFVGNEALQKYQKNEKGRLEIKGTQIDGIGVFVHEFGHALGLPDFYSTAKDSIENIETMHYWSVMDYGQYFYDSYAPIGYNAFERASMGWLDVKELNEPQYAELYAFGQEEKGVTAYCIKNKANPKEYYLLENRQLGTWYSKLLGKGMLITHIDYDRFYWDNNIVNTEKNHQRFEFIPADNEKSALNEKGRTDWKRMQADLFPGLNNVTEFTDTSIPSANVYIGGKLQQPLYNIKEESGVVSFCFMDKEMTGIQQIQIEKYNVPKETFTLDGRKMNNTQNLLPGVYLIKDKGKVQKVYLK